LLLVLLTLLGALFTDYRKAEASPIYRTWSQYLLGGPSVWATVPHPPVTRAIEAQIWRDVRTDPGGSDLMIQYLLWKQSLNPARFAIYHPRLAPALTKIANTPTTGSQQVSNPPPKTSGGGTTGPVQGQQVPEPGALLVALTITGWGLWRRHRGAKPDAVATR
jgi:hypothetical protein